MEWQDCTSYSRDRKDQQPDSWEVRHGRLSITITCGHIYYRPEWVLHCPALGMDTVPLPKGIGKEQAQAEALRLVAVKLDALKADFEACSQ